MPHIIQILSDNNDHDTINDQTSEQPSTKWNKSMYKLISLGAFIIGTSLFVMALNNYYNHFPSAFDSRHLLSEHKECKRGNWATINHYSSYDDTINTFIGPINSTDTKHVTIQAEYVHWQKNDNIQSYDQEISTTIEEAICEDKSSAISRYQKQHMCALNPYGECIWDQECGFGGICKNFTCVSSRNASHSRRLQSKSEYSGPWREGVQWQSNSWGNKCSSDEDCGLVRLHLEKDGLVCKSFAKSHEFYIDETHGFPTRTARSKTVGRTKCLPSTFYRDYFSSTKRCRFESFIQGCYTLPVADYPNKVPSECYFNEECESGKCVGNKFGHKRGKCKSKENTNKCQVLM